MRQAIADVDEIWAGSEFVRDAFRAVTVKPVHSLPPALELPVPSDRDRARRSASSDDRFVFLCTFDLFSVIERKNPFGAHRGVLAVPFAIGTTSRLDHQDDERPTPRPSQFERLRLATNGLNNVGLFDEHFSRADQMALIREADALVSLHRSEGLGLHLAEAMALGTPVIATRYSGNLDFMDDDNSLLVDATLRADPVRGRRLPRQRYLGGPRPRPGGRHHATDGRWPPTELVAKMAAAKRTAAALAGDRRRRLPRPSRRNWHRHRTTTR